MQTLNSTWLGNREFWGLLLWTFFFFVYICSSSRIFAFRVQKRRIFGVDEILRVPSHAPNQTTVVVVLWFTIWRRFYFVFSPFLFFVLVFVDFPFPLRIYWLYFCKHVGGFFRCIYSGTMSESLFCFSNKIVWDRFANCTERNIASEGKTRVPVLLADLAASR